MLIQELKLPKDIEIKFYRLSYPILNTSNLPLSGIYQPEPLNSQFPFENKFAKFSIGNLENFFSLNSSFGKVFLHEKLEGLIIFANNSDNHITIKDLDINIIIEPIKDSKNKIQKKISDVKLPPSGIQIRPKNAFSVKMEIFLDIVGKYMIDINLRVRSSAYNTLYNTLKLKGKVRDSPKEFRIVDGNVESLNNKKLTFDVNFPFKIKEVFHNKQLNECFVDIKIKNNTIYPITICDLFLSPKLKKAQSSKLSDILSMDKNNNQEIINKIPLVQTLEEINNNEFIPLDKSINNIINNTKYTTIESDEEINLLFKITDSNIYNIEPIFILEIKWLNLFDAKIKKFLYEFPNQLNTFNKFYKISVIEKPEGNIIKGQNFYIKLKLETKNPQKKYVITLRQDIMKDDDKSSDREIEIIDIIEKKIELNSNKTFDNFMLICKSDIIGNVYLPRLKFLVLEDGGITQSGNTYDTLLFFNCVDN